MAIKSVKENPFDRKKKKGTHNMKGINKAIQARPKFQHQPVTSSEVNLLPEISPVFYFHNLIQPFGMQHFLLAKLPPSIGPGQKDEFKVLIGGKEIINY